MSLPFKPIRNVIFFTLACSRIAVKINKSKFEAVYRCWRQIDQLIGPSRGQLLGLAASLRQLAPFEEVFPISATRGFGMADLREYLLSRCALQDLAL